MEVKSVSFSGVPQIKKVDRLPTCVAVHKKVSMKEYIDDHFDDKKRELASRGTTYKISWKERMAVPQWLRLEYRKRYVN